MTAAEEARASKNGAKLKERGLAGTESRGITKLKFRFYAVAWQGPNGICMIFSLNLMRWIGQHQVSARSKSRQNAYERPWHPSTLIVSDFHVLPAPIRLC